MNPFGPPRPSRLAAARYWARVFWFPALCVALMALSLQRAGAANSNEPERPLVEQPSPVTPVLSARRVPNVIALPTQASQLVGPVTEESRRREQ